MEQNRHDNYSRPSEIHSGLKRAFDYLTVDETSAADKHGEYMRCIKNRVGTPKHHADRLVGDTPSYSSKSRNTSQRIDDRYIYVAHAWVECMRKGDIQGIENLYHKNSDWVRLSDSFCEKRPPHRIVTLMHLAAEEGNIDVIKYLRNRDVLSDFENDSRKAETPLIWAVRANQIEVVRLLISMECRVDCCSTGGIPVIWIAVRNGFSNIARILLTNGANENETYQGVYLIEKAANNKDNKMDVDMMLLLIDRNANLNPPSEDAKQSVLHIAVRQKQNAIIEALIEKNANMTCLDKNGLAPLHVAARIALNESYDPINILIHNGADIDIQTRKGNTALHIASLGRNRELVKYLLYAGANLFKKNKNGETPAQTIDIGDLLRSDMEKVEGNVRSSIKPPQNINKPSAVVRAQYIKRAAKMVFR
jgi:ankyrin repeat protein